MLEVAGGVENVLDAIQTELDEHDAHAVVIDLTPGVTIRGIDIYRIAGVLEDRGIDRLQVRLDDDEHGQSIVISLV